MAAPINPNNAPASGEVLKTPELVELIVKQTDPSAMFKVNDFINQVVNDSNKVKEALFLTPVHRTPDVWEIVHADGKVELVKVYVFNSLVLEPDFPMDGIKKGAQSAKRLRFSPYLRSKVKEWRDDEHSKIDRTVSEEEKLFRGMQLTRPAIYDVQFSLYESGPKPDLHHQHGGMTVGDLLEGYADSLADQGLVGGSTRSHILVRVSKGMVVLFVTEGEEARVKALQLLQAEASDGADGKGEGNVISVPYGGVDNGGDGDGGGEDEVDYEIRHESRCNSPSEEEEEDEDQNGAVENEDEDDEVHDEDEEGEVEDDDEDGKVEDEPEDDEDGTSEGEKCKGGKHDDEASEDADHVE